MDDGVKDNCNGVADNDVRRNGRQRWQDVDGDGVTGDNDNDDGNLGLGARPPPPSSLPTFPAGGGIRVGLL